MQIWPEKLYKCQTYHLLNSLLYTVTFQYFIYFGLAAEPIALWGQIKFKFQFLVYKIDTDEGTPGKIQEIVKE